MSGPTYLFCGSSLTDDMQLLRALLEGLNTQARQWSEVITILNDGSLPGLEGEVEDYRYLQHRRMKAVWDTPPNIVIAFMDRLSHNRNTEELLRHAVNEAIPTYVISRYETP